MKVYHLYINQTHWAELWQSRKVPFCSVISPFVDFDMFDATLKSEIHVKPMKSNSKVVPEAPQVMLFILYSCWSGASLTETVFIPETPSDMWGAESINYSILW